MDFLLLGLCLHWLLRRPSGVVLCLLGACFQMLPAAPSGCPGQCRCEGRLLYCEALNLTEAPHNPARAGGRRRHFGRCWEADTGAGPLGGGRQGWRGARAGGGPA